MKQDRHISGMVERLRSFHAANNAERLREGLLRWAEDPLKPRRKLEDFISIPFSCCWWHWPCWASGTFLFFSLVQP